MQVQITLCGLCLGGKQLVADKKAVKLVKQQERGINVLTTTDK